MSDPNLPVAAKTLTAVRNAKCSDTAKAALAAIFGHITRPDQKDRHGILEVLKAVISDEAVTDSDEVADEFAMAAAALGPKAVRRSTTSDRHDTAA